MAITVEIIRAWPRRSESATLTLAAGATVAEALSVSGFSPEEVAGYAVFGERVTTETLLRDGDRLELLRPLRTDPKQARRRRARNRPLRT